MDRAETGLRLEASISGLAEKAPSVSVRRLLSTSQLTVLLASVLLIVAGCVVDVDDTLLALGAVLTLMYLSCVVYRFRLFVRSTGAHVSEVVSDDEARAVPDDELPTYSVLVPAYHEAEVVTHLVANLSRLEYPTDRLEILLLVEEDDAETLAALGDEDPGAQFHLVLVPPAEPRTKPKALNFGLTLARGELVAVYDAEDEPDPLQLRRAAVALGRLGPDVGCLQAKLSYSNPSQNLITRSVHHRVRHVVQLLPPRPGVPRRPHPARWDVQPLSPCRAACHGRVGSLQRHRGCRSRHPDGS